MISTYSYHTEPGMGGGRFPMFSLCLFAAGVWDLRVPLCLKLVLRYHKKIMFFEIMTAMSHVFVAFSINLKGLSLYFYLF